MTKGAGLGVCLGLSLALVPIGCADSGLVVAESDAASSSGSAAEDPPIPEVPSASTGESAGEDTEPGPPSEEPAGSTGASTGGDETGDETTGPGEPVDPGPPFERADLDAPHAAVPGARGPGQAWADMDGDGWLDLLTVGGELPSRLWHNEGDGTFTLDPASAELDGYLDTAGVTLVDYDNDGDPDVHFTRKGPNVLLRNDGVGFVDVTEEAGVIDPVWSSSAAWGDYDRDGWLDLYVANTGIAEDSLYHSNGDGTFTVVSDLLLYRDKFQAYAATFSDFDDDGDLDLYVANDKRVGNQMWRNDGPGCGGWCFTNVSAQWGVDFEIDSMGVAVGDYDNDLDLDFSVSDNHTHLLTRNTLETGAIGFDDVSTEAGVVFDAHGWGTVFLDYDSDGWLDLFVADGDNSPGHANRMFHNEQDGTFADVGATCGCIEPGFALGASAADYDHDGAVDFIVGNRGSHHDLFHNRNTSGHHWLTVELRGGGSVNRDAVGSRVWVTTTSGQVLMREIKLGSSVVSQNSLRLHFGLGGDQVQAVEIRWPDGLVETPAPPPTDALWVHDYPAP